MESPFEVSSSEKIEGRQRSNSTSSIRIQGTVDNPNTTSLIQSIASAILSNLYDDLQEGRVITPKSGKLYFFSEELYIKANSQDFDNERIVKLREIPCLEVVSQFMEVRFNLKFRRYMIFSSLVRSAL